MPQRFIVEQVREVLAEVFPDLTPEQLDHFADEQATALAARVTVVGEPSTYYIEVPQGFIDRLLLTRWFGKLGKLVGLSPRCRCVPVHIDWSKLDD